MAEDRESKNTPPQPVTWLQQRAEELLGIRGTEVQTVPVADVQRLMHEIEVHQVELEMQNEELRRVQHELAASRDRYSDLYDFAPVGYVTLDNRGGIQQANLTACGLLRVERKLLVGKPLSRFLARDDADTLYRHCQAVCTTGATHTCELRLQPQGGTVPIVLRLESMAVADENGANTRCRTALLDITANKRAEHALLQAKEEAETSNRVKSEFLATMSHELRTPLHVIIGYLDLMIEGEFGLTTEEESRVLQQVRRSAGELSEHIAAMLDLNRIEMGQMGVEVTEVRMPELLTEIQADTQGLQEQSGLAFTWRENAALPVLRTDRGKLKVVIKNLLGNAVKFTPVGSITVAAHRRNGGVEISVTDTGVGIPPEGRAAIFEPFYQLDNSTARKYEGSGLGLHIVKRLLELLQGTIEIESEVGRGSTFRVWIPPLQK